MRIVVTGGNSGVGKATAAQLAAAGHRPRDGPPIVGLSVELTGCDWPT